MTTIDKLDLSVYNLYAMRTKMIEQINQQLHLEEASSIPPQTQLINIYPKLTELDILLGIVPMHTPWAFFFPPKQFRYLRRSPFSFYRVAPSLGTYEEQSQDEMKIEGTICEKPEEENEKKVLLDCFSQIKKLNSWLSFIIGRVGQFLQG